MIALRAASERDDCSQVFVDPSGTRTLVVSVVPQRTKRPDGTWGPADVVHIPSQNLWTYASQDGQNGPMNDNRIKPGEPSPAATELYVGNDPGTTHHYRSFMRFPIGNLAGTQILGASIQGRVDHTYLCSSNRPTYFCRSGSFSSGARKAWPGPALEMPLGNNNVHANEASCTEPNVDFEVGTDALRNDLQLFANSRASSYFVGLSAGSTEGVPNGAGELNQDRWMRYFLADFKRRMTRAWTPGDGDCAATPATGTLGGPAPYWHDHTYDVLAARQATKPSGRTRAAADEVSPWADANRSKQLQRPHVKERCPGSGDPPLSCSTASEATPCCARKHGGRQAHQAAARHENGDLIDACDWIRHELECAPTAGGGSILVMEPLSPRGGRERRCVHLPAVCGRGDTS